MLKKRIIARIDVKNEFVIKGIHLEGLRKVGNPHELAVSYYEAGIDEIIFMDAVASLYGRNNLFHIIEQACRDVFVPITVGGGIRSLDDIEQALKSGADKVAINTQAVKTPQLVSEAARVFGSQCIVASIEATRSGTSWEAYVDNGREHTGIDAIQWGTRLEELGAGEILVTSVDREGTRAGFDIELISRVCEHSGIPVIACGGAGLSSHLTDLFDACPADAVALASILHYNLTSVDLLKSDLVGRGVSVRQ